MIICLIITIFADQKQLMYEIGVLNIRYHSNNTRELADQFSAWHASNVTDDQTGTGRKRLSDSSTY